MKNYKDMATDELKSLLVTMVSISSVNENAKKIAKAIEKEIKRRSK